MNLIKPKKLNKGDTIAIVAPSGPVDVDKIKLAKQFFETNGYKVVLGDYLTERRDYLAGDDEKRISDLHSAFANSDIKAIICARGGYGALRLINKLDFELIKNNPKIFCGYSDITILNTMILKKSNLITFSGPMAQSDFAGNFCDYTVEKLFEALTKDCITIKPSESKIYYDGKTEGILFGGNLSTLTSLCGQDFIPNQKFIFFTEDLNEPVYKIDKYFTQLLNIPDFRNNLAGVILGDFLDLDNEKYFNNYFKDLANQLKLPFIGGFPISHSQQKATIPFGGYANLSNEKLIVSNFIGG